MNEGGEIGDTITSHRKLLILCRNHAGKFSIFRRLHFALTFGIFDFKLSFVFWGRIFIIRSQIYLHDF
jgi:hypothetical protein